MASWRDVRRIALALPETSAFDGYPTVLVRLDAITTAALRDVLLESWLTRAPKRVAAALLKTRPP